MSLVVPCNWLYHANWQMPDASVACKVCARNWTLVVFNKLFLTVNSYWNRVQKANNWFPVPIQMCTCSILIAFQYNIYVLNTPHFLYYWCVILALRILPDYSGMMHTNESISEINHVSLTNLQIFIDIFSWELTCFLRKSS